MDFYPIKQANLNECAVLFASVFNDPPWNENWNIEAVSQRFDDFYRTPGFYGLMIRDGDEVIGFALGFVERWDKSKLFYLKEMCVASASQRCGVGTALMKLLAEKLREQGVDKLYLHTARDTSAQVFYEKQDFHVSSRMIMMTKQL